MGRARHRRKRQEKAKKRRLGCSPASHLRSFIGQDWGRVAVKVAAAKFACDLFTTYAFKLSTVTQYLSKAGIEVLEPLGFGVIWTAKTNRLIKEVVDLAKKTQLAWVRRAKPIDRSFLRDAARFVALGKGGKRRRAHLRCLVTQWMFLGRVSEVVASGSAAGGTALLRKDVCTLDEVADGSLVEARRAYGAVAVALRFPASKTDQAMAGQTRAVGRTADPCICAVTAIEEQLAQPGRPTDPLFAGTSALSLGSFIASVARWSGRDPSAYSTHSARRGGASAYFLACQSETQLKYFGRWCPASTEHLVYMQPALEVMVKIGARMGASQATSLGW